MLMSFVAMMVASTGLRAQDFTLSLHPGWNWIGYPYLESSDLETVLGDFEPMTGDLFMSQIEFTEYDGEEWFGDDIIVEPGRGYMYYSKRTEAVDLVLHAPVSQFTVITATPTDITATSAVVGGTVTVPEGSHVFLRGVCWGTEPNPDIDGNHTSEEPGVGVFNSTLEGLTLVTTYYVRAYAVTDKGLAYGEELSFTTEHEYVDLGLPSGLLWATCNIGADSPEDYGDYFAWGETQPKESFGWSTYQYCNGSSNTLTKYCNLTILLPEDDAATANWGSAWRMPTEEEWDELLNSTTHTWTTQNGVNGWLFTASNGNSLFLPAAGWFGSSSLQDAANYGGYLSSTLFTGNPNNAWSFYFGSNNYSTYPKNRSTGSSVRAVRSSAQN